MGEIGVCTAFQARRLGWIFKSWRNETEKKSHEWDYEENPIAGGFPKKVASSTSDS